MLAAPSLSTSRIRWLVGLPVALVLVGGLLCAGARLNAQAPARDTPKTAAPAPAQPPVVFPSIQDALLRPYRFDFAEGTTLEDVRRHLQETLKARVVLDQAALARREVKPSTAVTLQLDGIRLKTGLKLLLDQAELTYRVVPEDNLLVITDAQGSDDPLDRLSREVKAIHQEIHDLQDAVDELRDVIDPLPADEGGNPKMRNPILKEEKPEGGARPKEKPGEERGNARSRPGF